MLSASQITFPQLLVIGIEGRFQDRTSTGCLFSYLLEDGQFPNTRPNAMAVDSCQQHTFGDLTVHEPAFWNSHRTGINILNTKSGERVVSTNNATSLNALVQTSTTATWEIWVQLNGIDKRGPIAFQGNVAAGDPDRVGCTNFDWVIEQEYGYVRFLVSGFTSTSKCSVLATELPEGVENAPLHLVFTRSATNRIECYVNGALIAFVTTAQGAYTNWNPLSHLHIAEEFATYSWEGAVLLLTMYNRQLPAAEILGNYNAGLPNNIPRTSDLHLIIPESGTANISLSAVDFDGDLLSFSLVTSPIGGTVYSSDGLMVSGELTSRSFLYQANPSFVFLDVFYFTVNLRY
jgi:hypothetical protein